MWAMYPFTNDGASHLNDLRARLLKMTDAELLRFGKAARYMCSPAANLGKPRHQAFVVQLPEDQI